MNELQNLILLNTPDTWSSAIKRQGWPVRLTWAIDIADLHSEALNRPGSFGIVGLGAENLPREIASFSGLLNNPFELTLVAVGSGEIVGLKGELRTVGFADVFGSTTEIAQLGQMIEQHFRHRSGQDLPLEERIQRDLPWKPLRTS